MNDDFPALKSPATVIAGRVLGPAEAAKNRGWRDSSLSAKSISCRVQPTIRDVSGIASAPVSAPRNLTTSASPRTACGGKKHPDRLH